MDMIVRMWELECDIRRFSSSEDIVQKEILSRNIKDGYSVVNDLVMSVNRCKMSLDMAMDKASIDRRDL